MTHAPMALPTYQPSGRIGVRAWMVFALLGVPLFAALGWAYACLLALSPSTPLDVVVVLVFWLCLMVAAMFIGDRSHSRSIRFSWVAGAAIGLAAWWMQWVVTLRSHGLDAHALAFVRSGPLGWLQVLQDFAAAKTVAGHASVSACAVLWGIEALALLLIPAALAKGTARQPYSEACRAWAHPAYEAELYAPGTDSAALPQALQQHGVEALLRMQPAEQFAIQPLASQWWTLAVKGHEVGDDPDARWLDLTLVAQSRGSDGRVKTQHNGLVKAWHVDAEAFEALRQHLSPAPDEPSHAAVAAPPAAERATPPELEPAVTALESGNYGAALGLAEAFVQHPDVPTRADAIRLCALANARLARWTPSFDHCDRLFEIEPTAFNALQLATTSVCCGQLMRGHAWLEQARRINADTAELPAVRIDTAYLSALEQAGEASAALPLLERLAAAYRALPTQDDHVVWSHGLPFFGEFLRKSLPMLRAALSEPQVQAWYEALRADLDAHAQAQLDRHVRQIAAADPAC